MVAPESIDIALCIFVLSAIDPSLHITVLRRIHKKLKVGGVIMFRDYGMYDLTMIRAAGKPGRLLGERCYARGDGTMYVALLCTPSHFFIKTFQEISTLCFSLEYSFVFDLAK